MVIRWNRYCSEDFGIFFSFSCAKDAFLHVNFWVLFDGKFRFWIVNIWHEASENGNIVYTTSNQSEIQKSQIMNYILIFLDIFLSKRTKIEPYEQIFNLTVVTQQMCIIIAISNITFPYTFITSLLSLIFFLRFQRNNVCTEKKNTRSVVCTSTNARCFFYFSLSL